MAACSRPRWIAPGAFLLFLAAAVSVQWFERAYGAEFAEGADAPAHYVTGLMVRDYVAAGLPGSPMEYAQAYYAHYPKIALGHWPPFFYIVLAAWTLVFSASRVSILVFLAALSALTAALLAREIGKRYPVPAALAAGLVLISIPQVALYSRTVMSEMLNPLNSL